MVAAHDGVETWESIIGDTPPALAIVDWMMPPAQWHRTVPANPRDVATFCSYCKRIRSDTNYWEQVERYISDHTDIRFSHGVCPPCMEKAMAESDPPEVPMPGTAD